MVSSWWSVHLEGRGGGGRLVGEPVTVWEVRVEEDEREREREREEKGRPYEDVNQVFDEFNRRDLGAI